MSAFRERLGQLIYEAVYADQGGKWEAVEPREVWYAKADWLMAQEPRISVAPELLEELSRMAEHFGAFARDHSMEASTETWSALYCAEAVISKAGGRS